MNGPHNVCEFGDVLLCLVLRSMVFMFDEIPLGDCAASEVAVRALWSLMSFTARNNPVEDRIVCRTTLRDESVGQGTSGKSICESYT